ncbi:MAG TPA: BMP family ABC transporter substrate-binding protein [Caldimonas sp.]|jgi:simple sugar transport system substrate-binding protein|nr:BMP family ABC transporter substrate-binding protein [Caldimonas sp.]
MMKNLIRGSACALLSAVAALAAPLLSIAASSAPASAAPAAKAPLVVGFVYVTPVGEAGWTYQHELGRREMAKVLGARVRTIAVESVAEGADAGRVMRDLVAQQGATLVFATSFGYLDPALRVAAEFPQARFEHAGGYKTAPNLATYDARYYEARWLAGWLAGRASRSGVAGYVAGFPVPEVVQGINAFTLGMRAANPKATVRVVWLDTWFDPAKERDAAQTLIDQGADVLTHHSASTAVAQAAQANFRDRHVRVVSYPSDMRAFAPDAQLAAIVHRWGGFYTRVAGSVIDGSWRPEPVWGGIASGMVDIDALDPTLTKEVRAGLQARRAAIVAGSLAPFAAPLVDNAGTTRLARGALADADIKTMDWFVAGVVGNLPKAR